MGLDSDPHPGTIKYFESQIRFLDDELAEKIARAREARRNIVEAIFESKRQVLSFYADLKASVEERLSAVRTEEFLVAIEASFVADRTFSQAFLNLIDQRRKGPFRVTVDAQRELNARLGEVNWNDFSSVFALIEGIIKTMLTYDGKSHSLKEQVTDVKEFYDFMYSLEYVSAKYELRLGGKNLNELSPGEKGLLLLIFYLQLDKDNVPLVIDQPEDNLDNDSIFAVLARCIRDAKKRRQVILVTHNPNLAVGADAEQIIYVRLEKAKNYKFSYDSGAIENPRINPRIVDVLEGSQPAFVQRRLKYQIS
ncbi:MAG: hypothetical protein RBS99_07425 [Rhodospirillales bacterium]|nr:hypothetical protein [Rhodospirillales bacterium]